MAIKIDDLFWLDTDDLDRSSGIGASDAAYLVDSSKWVDDKFKDGPSQLLAVKTGRHKIKQNILMSWGKVLEHHVVDLEYEPTMPDYEIGSGQPIHQVVCPVTYAENGYLPSHVVRNKDYPFLRCSPDRLICDSEENILCGLEIKTSWAYSQDWVLDAYMPQLQWSMLVTGLPKWELFCSFQTKKPGTAKRNARYMVEADPIMQAEMLDRAQKFWPFVLAKAEELPDGWDE